MPPDLQLVKQWLHRARLDLRSAEVLLSEVPPLCEEAGFHCQQSIEKALKAFLVSRVIPFDWSHQIGYLLDLCVTEDEQFEQFRVSAAPLSEYAIRFRYPHPEPAPEKSQVHQALKVARQVYNFILERMPEETRPTT
jgi:HEPN domain-containing protein